jgi:hypothetical protein
MRLTTRMIGARCRTDPPFIIRNEGAELFV